ncbi:MAG: acyl--CoA ligase [Lachnospiraceae bacterium]|nr:acyl--CoA ligase [Lachnospiraceae bacterium]
MGTETPYRQRDHLEYPELTMFQMIKRVALEHPNEPAYEFYGKKTTYWRFLKRIERAARAFWQAGIGPGDVVTICMPNTPQALDCFYAVNRIGAIANMVHPLSAQNEITHYLKKTNSRIILTPDLFYEKVRRALDGVGHPVRILTARIQDELLPHLAAAYVVKKGKDYLTFPNRVQDELWTTFVLRAHPKTALPEPKYDPERTSVILYSGGTSGPPKGICLSDLNFNACAMQAVEAIGETFRTGLKMLSCMPIFHGFGLGINIHTVVIHGACCILMPTFTDETYAQMLIRKRPHFIAGVPTIFEALLRNPELEGKDLSFLRGMFCGGDALSAELKKRIDLFLVRNHARIQVREGYGLTECVTASCLTPRDDSREGSIGLPFPDTEYRIVRPGTDEILPPGEEGEIILTGPTVMLGYYKDEAATAKTLRTLSDGRRWLYTGDLGCMDEDGFVYFRQRMKRMIITNGYNVYPSRIEKIIDSCPGVEYSCVIGVRDPRRMQRVRAYVVLSEGVPADDGTRNMILQKLRKNIAAYAIPKEIVFREELPRTLVGKVAYSVIQEEADREEAASGGEQDAGAGGAQDIIIDEAAEAGGEA